MKQGRTLQDMAAKLTEQLATKKDYVATTNSLEMLTYGGELSLGMHNGETNYFGITNHAHSQIAARLKIPQRYYDRMREEGSDLLAGNVNHWFTNEPETRLIRTMDGTARAFLSNRYRRLDNYDLMEQLMPTFGKLNAEHGLKIHSSEITDSKLYIKAIFPNIEREVKKGDVVQSGVMISNSEIGQGQVSVTPLIYRLICSNGMIANDYGMKRRHVGRIESSEEQVRLLYKDDTLQADDKAFWMKIRDVVEAAASDVTFSIIVDDLTASAEDKVKNPIKSVELLANNYGLNSDEHAGVLTGFIEGGDLSRYGLLNAVTAFSQKVDDYDRATELEALGGTILGLSSSEWASLEG